MLNIIIQLCSRSRSKYKTNQREVEMETPKTLKDNKSKRQ